MKLNLYTKKLCSFMLFFFIVNGLQGYVAGVANAANSVDDAVITTKIKTQFVQNPALKNSSIAIETTNAVVKLKGLVESDTAASSAVQIAESTEGVMDVDTDGLNVKNSTQPLQDTYITAKVNGMLIREKLFNNSEMPISQIKVETKDGVVYLSGKVAQTRQAKRAVALAQSVNGVRKVISNIKINQ